MLMNIVAVGIILIAMAIFCWYNYKKCEDYIEKILYIMLFFITLVPIIIYYLDRYNVPTYMGWTTNVNSQNWLAFLANYSAGIMSAIIGAIVLVIVTVWQINRNKEDSIERDKLNLRIQNMPILKYKIDSKENNNGKLEEFILTNIDDGINYNFNILIKNVGLNTVKSIKVDIKMDSLINLKQRILGRDTIYVLDKEEEVIINSFLTLKSSEEPYNIFITVYYEDALSNWYEQVINVKFTATNISRNGENIGIIEFEVEEEKIIEKKDINNRLL